MLVLIRYIKTSYYIEARVGNIIRKKKTEISLVNVINDRSIYKIYIVDIFLLQGETIF
jgi:hypothetical protein